MLQDPHHGHAGSCHAHPSLEFSNGVDPLTGLVGAVFQSLLCRPSVECFSEPAEAATGYRGRIELKF